MRNQAVHAVLLRQHAAARVAVVALQAVEERDGQSCAARQMQRRERHVTRGDVPARAASSDVTVGGSCR